MDDLLGFDLTPPDELFRPDVINDILTRLAAGETLRAICRDPPAHLAPYPSDFTVRMWHVEDRDGFASQFARARDAGIVARLDECHEIADDGRNDWMEKQTLKGNVITVLNQEHVQRSKLRIDYRKWEASKILHKTYGDKLDISTLERPLNSVPDDERMRLLTSIIERVQERDDDDADGE